MCVTAIIYLIAIFIDFIETFGGLPESNYSHPHTIEVNNPALNLF